ncbi:nitrite reductase, copper-containing [Pedobacter changchengzhani]|uniref:Copper-containing nitrite reductase n=1 Tax=Pedobacter changchengzhani TaxID=2529274 RepID=A0A4R5MKR8_9SPHI|nr:copper-containing nitrite reductase [Pedobacter changchengzhani]TDG36016.1 nitrite reductase, copper-containing [Pedobacter changchengzhani]
MKILFIPLIICVISACNQSKSTNQAQSEKENIGNLKHVTQQLVAPPYLPKYDQIASGDPVVVDVKLTIAEKKLEIAPGVKIWALTFNGSVPGPMIVVHQNDYVQLTLINPSTNSLTHNIDFHAATGAMGGGDLSLVNPGQQVTIRFKATKAGVFIYHCAPGGIMVPLHVTSGMNGAIMVLPREGLKDEKGNAVHYDKAFYIAEQDYYVPKDANGKYKEYETPGAGFDDMTKVFKTLTPTHLVFNGVTGALTGKNALTANVGDKVLFITSQANRDTRIHLIGGHADLVWLGGSFNDKPATNYESWPVVAGSAVAALYQFKEPGMYAYLNHNLIEAFAFGAVAQIKVKGNWDDNLMKQITKPEKIN